MSNLINDAGKVIPCEEIDGLMYIRIDEKRLMEKLDDILRRINRIEEVLGGQK